jgi:ABC-type transporter Mla subunit MlaD
MRWASGLLLVSLLPWGVLSAQSLPSSTSGDLSKLTTTQLLEAAMKEVASARSDLAQLRTQLGELQKINAEQATRIEKLQASLQISAEATSASAQESARLTTSLPMLATTLTELQTSLQNSRNETQKARDAQVWIGTGAFVAGVLTTIGILMATR